jgi:oligopeptidase B
MRQISSLLVFSCCVMFLSCSPGPEEVRTKKVPREFHEQGHTRADDYAWLSNPKDSAVIAHLQEENAYVEAMMRHTENLQKKIYDELVARIDRKYLSLPQKQNGYWYYTRYEEAQQYPFYCRKQGSTEAQEEIFLDLPALARGHQIYVLRGYEISRDNRWLAYGIDTTGDRRCLLFFKDLTSSRMSPETIANTSGNYVWAMDGKTLYYVVNDHTVRAYKVKRHTLGTDPATDREVFVERDSTFEVGLSTTRDNRYIFVTSGSTLTSECRYIDALRSGSTPVIIQPRRKDLLYTLDDYEGKSFFIQTNSNAKNFKLVRAPIRAPGMKNWVDLIPHRTDALLEHAEVFTRYIVAQQYIQGLPRILIINRSTNQQHYVDFGEEAYVADMYPATDAYDLDSIRFSYSSLTTPRSDFRYGLISRIKTLLKQDRVGGGYDPALYETKRLWATAPDGAKVPISMVYKKSLLKGDGSNPALLYAYGSYGASTSPSFNSAVVSLLDRGFVFAIGHIRGGQEMGRHWYEDGKLLKKKNTFTDFVACAEYLVREHFTTPERLFINGGSAGGMLMGAVTNMRPDLFRGVLAEVPWMDIITDSFNTDLPLTTLEFDEWGDPHDREQYEYMLSWSPYDNVRRAHYPAIFATGGLNDTQVPYFSPAKWVARVRDNNTGTNPILFKCNMGAGHSGESGRFERQKLTALKYAFMLDLLGMRE